MTQVRLVAIDIDGTLLDDAGRMPEGTREAVKRLQGGGAEVVITTGRMLRSARPIEASLGTTGPLIGYNGALIVDAHDRPCLHRPVPHDEVSEVAQQARRDGVTLLAYVDDQVLVERIDDAVEAYMASSNVPAEAVGDLVELARSGRLRGGSTKLLGIAPPPVVERLVPAWRHRFGRRLRIVRSKPHYIEVTHPQASKGRALAALVRHLGLRRDQVMAIGDSENDLTMLRFARYSVAVGNANEEVRRVARWVVRPAGDGGVIEALERLA